MKPGFAAALTAWYGGRARDLPWRRTRNPYHIWVSEVMLQQTQVDTVLRYYDRWLERFESVAALAAAPLDDVLKAWEGLGYYARCRNLHAAAQALVETSDGQVPETLEAVQALRGVGRSTAGAILCFAHGQRHPILDGNVKRVIARVCRVEGELGRGPTMRELWGHSEALLATAEDPYAFNQALMELGALVCTPRSPTCEACPVAAHCEARAAGVQSELPRKKRRKPLPHHHIGVGVIRGEERLLIQQRPTDGLLGGLWEFPGGKQEPGEAIEETVRREIAEELGIEVAVEDHIATVDHAYTHFKITLHAYHCRHVSGDPEPRSATGLRWIRPAELDDYAFPSANRRIIDVLQPR